MKRLSLLALSVAFATPALAADLVYETPTPIEPTVSAPAIEPIATTTTWTGIYVGVQGGIALTDNDSNIGFGADDNDFFGRNDSFDVFGNDTDEAFIGGAHIGADYQVGNIVIGAVADINYVDANSYRTYDFGANTVGVAEDLDYVGSVRGRLGYAFDNLMVYGSGGLSYAGYDREYQGPSTITANGVNYAVETDGDEADFGYAVGGGVDYLVTDNISLGLEYLYTNLGENDFEVRGTGTNAAGQEVTFSSDSGDEDYDFHTIWAKASYRFN